MKAHPGAAAFHILLESRALSWNLRSRIEKNDDLVMRKELCIQIAPIGCRIIRKIIFQRHFRKPLVGFMDETDMGQIIFAGVKGNDIKSRNAVCVKTEQ